ncbi:MAG TPA: autotransporter-associated beta strand repeat-containing protein, partial [Tepidisphaeraceae bacterium]|nr:autotransporter-associated beta strand repeat-containing protein [Tepidisphaeraceae bacterium]
MTFARKTRRNQALLAAIAATSCWLSHPAGAQFLSVDLNGGDAQSGNNLSPNLGWDGTTNQPVNGFVWTPWGGRTSVGGDGTNFLPFNPSTPVLGVTKSFTTGAVTSGAITVSLTAGTTTGTGLNSRDRGAGGGSTNYADMYRDLIFVPRNTNLQSGGSPLIISLSGLNKNTTYTFTGFAIDPSDTGQQLFGEVNPVLYDYGVGSEQIEVQGKFANPPQPLDGTQIGPRVFGPAGADFTGATDGTGHFGFVTSPYQFSSTFHVTADNNGNATFYEWSNINVNEGGTLQTATVLNGFQVGTAALSSTFLGNGGTITWDAGFAGNVPNADKAIANFGSVASAQNVTIDAAGRTAGVVNIASPTAYTIGGGTLTMSDSFPADPNLPPPPPSPPDLTSDTTGHAEINILGDSTFSAVHTISAPVVLKQNTTINAMVSSLVLSGNVSGSGSLNKLGNGTVTLSGNNTYGGATNIIAGRLVVNGQHTGGGDYTVTAGASLGGTGTVSLRDDIQQPNTAGVQNGKVAMWNGSAIAPGDGGVGTLTIDRLALGSPAPHGSGSVTLNIDIGGGSADRLNVTDTGNGTFTDGLYFANGTGTLSINVSALAGATTGVFPILDYSGSVFDMNAASISALSRISLASTSVGGFTLGLVDNTANTSIDLQVALAGPSSWVGGGPNNNWGTSLNWSGLIPNGIDATANFGTVASGSYSVNVEGAKMVGSMTFSGANSYTLSGSTITFQSAGGAPQIVVTSGNHTIGTPVQLNNFLFINVQGTSTLNITGPVVATASGREISTSGGGTVQFASLNMNVGGGAGTLLVNTGTAKIAQGGSSNSAAGTSIMAGLTLGGVTDAWTGRFDLTNNSLLLDYPTAGPSPIATIQNQLKQGYAGGAWNGTGGIISSTAAG